MTKQEKRMSALERTSVKLTEWVGTTQSLVVHTIFFVGIFLLPIFGIGFDEILLILTTAVSLEAIYLALFIQMTVNRNTESLEDVGEDIDEIQEDIQEFEGDFDEMQDNVEDLETNLAMMHRNVEEISGDIDQIQQDDKEEDSQEEKDRKTMHNIEVHLLKLSQEMLAIKKDLNTLKKV